LPAIGRERKPLTRYARLANDPQDKGSCLETDFSFSIKVPNFDAPRKSDKAVPALATAAYLANATK
jgi:hypothetical protein